jgi:DNA polymerase-4
MRLRTARLWTTQVSLTIKYATAKAQSDGQHSSGIPQTVWSQGLSVIECQDSQTLVETLCKLWAARPQDAKHAKPFFIGVWLGLGDHPKAAIDDQVKSGHREKA